MTATYTGTCRHCGRHLEKTLPRPWDEHGTDAFSVDCPTPSCDRAESMVYRDDPETETDEDDEDERASSTPCVPERLVVPPLQAARVRLRGEGTNVHTGESVEVSEMTTLGELDEGTDRVVSRLAAAMTEAA